MTATNKRRYRANGTIHVHSSLGDEKINAVTFIPDQYIEQDGDKFVIFLPLDDGAEEALCVKGKNVKLRVNSTNGNSEVLILRAAVNSLKVTVIVFSSEEKWTIKEVVVPAIPTVPAE